MTTAADVAGLLLPSEVAAQLRLSVRTLEKMRLNGSSLKFVRLGKRVLYDPIDVRAFIEASKFASTAAAARAGSPEVA